MSRDRDQLELFWLCHVCGQPHLDRRDHQACYVALDRWFREDNLEVWRDDPGEVAL